ncbi:MAG TPA: hypothetical protein VMF69_28775 [Gemmataceae bacterium]|nr:hypothetical protein [Gemmataceae bacterium]
MSLMIESMEELLTLLKKMNLKVSSVDELHQLLASINANYNPDAARQKTGRQIGTIVPGAMAGAAAFASYWLLVGSSTDTAGILAVIWGPAAFVSTAAVIAAAVLSCAHRGRTMPDNAPVLPAPRGEPVVTHIIKELPI